MNCIFQLVRPDNGKRLPAVTMSRSEYARVLQYCVRDAPGMVDYLVLVLADDVQADGNFRMCYAPMMRVDSFINEFGDSNGEDVLAAPGSVGTGSFYQHAEG